MTQPNRREFLKQSAAGLAGATSLAAATELRAAGANRRLSVGLIGCGGRGTSVAETFAQLDGIELSYVCDPDQRRLKQAEEKLGGQAVADFRAVLDDRSVDAVIVATPDHWHAPASILACKAGKHVYVEKPCSHNIREGRLLVEVARSNNRVVQHGTQVRSTEMMIKAVQMLHDGIIGDVLAAKAWNVQKRRSIGHEQPSQPPAELDYDTWIGPAPMIPYQNNRVHDGWHWWFSFGTGDIGNDGIHDLEYARWGLGMDRHPTAVSALGGKYFFDDDQEFPDTQQVTYEYDLGDQRRMLIYEQRLWSTNYPFNVDSGVEFYGTSGRLFLSRRGKAQLLDSHNARVGLDIPLGPQDTKSHVADFADAVRNDRRPNADIQFGHWTATLSHLGNIATRLKRTLQFDGETEQFVNDSEANQLVTRTYRPQHWAVPDEV